MTIYARNIIMNTDETEIQTYTKLSMDGMLKGDNQGHENRTGNRIGRLTGSMV